jgi:hypothetical protein
MRAATRNGGVRAASWMGRGHGTPAPEVTFAQVTPVTFPKRHGFLESSVLRIIRSSGTTPLTQGFAIMRMRYVVGLFLLFSYCFGRTALDR